MTQGGNDKRLSEQERQLIEGQCTFQRITELELVPVRGKFDIAHLKEVHRRIFQDLPSHGINELPPGEFRQQVESGEIWKKERAFKTLNIDYTVVYSNMDAQAHEQLNKVLEKAAPENLKTLGHAEFSKTIAKIYSEIDYIHPFKDGNSRTLRAFTQQLASESGYAIEWDKCSINQAEIEKFYKARDISVHKVALQHTQNETLKRHYSLTLNYIGEKDDLSELMKEIVRP